MEKMAGDENHTSAGEPLVGSRDAVRTPEDGASIEESEYHTLEKILSYDSNLSLFRVKWLGYDETTKEPRDI